MWNLSITVISYIEKDKIQFQSFLKTFMSNMQRDLLKSIISESAKKAQKKIEDTMKLEKAQREAEEKKKFEYATAVILELFAVNSERQQGLQFYQVDQLFREQDGEDVSLTTGQMQLILDILTEEKYIHIITNSEDPQKSAYGYNLK